MKELKLSETEIAIMLAALNAQYRKSTEELRSGKVMILHGSDRPLGDMEIEHNNVLKKVSSSLMAKLENL